MLPADPGAQDLGGLTSPGQELLQRGCGRRILVANRSRRLTTPQTVRPSTTGRWRNPFLSMIPAASSTGVSGLADCGSGVIQSFTRDTRRSSPDAAERSTSRSVRIPARNRPCITMAEPTFALIMPAAASATGVSGEVSATRVLIKSRSTTRGTRLAGSVTAAHLVEFAVEMGGGRPGQLLR